MASEEGKASRGKHAAHAKPAQSDASQTQPLKAAGDTDAFDAVSTSQGRSSTTTSPDTAYAQVRTIDIPSKRSKNKHPVLKVILGVLVVALIAVAAYGIWFSLALNSTLDNAQKDTISGNVLEPTSAGQPFYLLAIGSDSREGSTMTGTNEGVTNGERSDVMILVRIDPNEHVMTMLSIPRDTPYELPDGTVVKINEMFNQGGATQLVKAINDITGIRVSHYGVVHFSELENIVDALGGVTVNVPIELSYQDALTGEWVTIEPGTQTLDGQQAQIFARARHEYGTAQDANRQNAVRTLAMAIVKKVLDRPVNEIPGAVLDVAQYVGTDMRAMDVVSLAVAFGTSIGNMTVYTGTGPSDGSINNANDLWMCYRNPEGWKKVMEVVDSGGNPEGMDFSDTAIPW